MSNPPPDLDTPTDAVPTWPRVTVHVRDHRDPDTTAPYAAGQQQHDKASAGAVHADIVVNGAAHAIPPQPSVEAARETVIAHIATETASRLGRPVRVTTTDPDGTWHLIVHPDGTVDEAAPPTLVSSGEAPETPRRRGRLVALGAVAAVVVTLTALGVAVTQAGGGHPLRPAPTPSAAPPTSFAHTFPGTNVSRSWQLSASAPATLLVTDRLTPATGTAQPGGLVEVDDTLPAAVATVAAAVTNPSVPLTVASPSPLTIALHTTAAADGTATVTYAVTLPASITSTAGWQQLVTAQAAAQLQPVATVLPSPTPSPTPAKPSPGKASKKSAAKHSTRPTPVRTTGAAVATRPVYVPPAATAPVAHGTVPLPAPTTHAGPVIAGSVHPPS